MKRCNMILDVATEGFWDWDLKSDRAYLSPRYCELVGYSPQEAVFDYNFFRVIVHPDDLPMVEQAVQDHLHGKRKYRVQYRMLSRDGSIRWIESRGKVVEFDENGVPARMVGTILDISERKAVEEELTRKASLLELSNDSIIVRDMDSRITYWNAGAVTQYGWQSEEAVGRVSHELLSTVFPEPLDAIMVTLLRTGHWEGELIHARRDGSVIAVSSRWSLQKDEHGAAEAVLEINNDVTSRLAAEEAVRQSESQFRVMFELTSVGMCQADPATGMMLKVNEPLAKMTGYSREELIGRTFSEITHEEDRQSNWEDFARLVRGEISSYEVEKRFIRKDGGVIWVHVTSNIVRDESGTPLRTIAILYDITARKQSEQKVAMYEQRLRSLAVELAKTEDRERKRLATELHEHVAQCLAAARMNFRQLMKMDYPPEYQSVAGMVGEAIDEATAKIRGVLTELCPPAFVYRDVVHAIEWVVDRIAEQHGLNVAIEDDGQPKPVDDDLMMFLTSAVRELLTNVVKHARATHAQVSIERRDGIVTIRVSDDGAGFDSATVGSEYDSTGGFGLFNIRERMSYHGGTFVISSESGKGTTVTMVVPCQDGEDRREASSEGAEYPLK